MSRSYTIWGDRTLAIIYKDNYISGSVPVPADKAGQAKLTGIAVEPQRPNGTVLIIQMGTSGIIPNTYFGNYPQINVIVLYYYSNQSVVRTSYSVVQQVTPKMTTLAVTLRTLTGVTKTFYVDQALWNANSSHIIGNGIQLVSGTQVSNAATDTIDTIANWVLANGSPTGTVTISQAQFKAPNGQIKTFYLTQTDYNNWISVNTNKYLVTVVNVPNQPVTLAVNTGADITSWLNANQISNPPSSGSFETLFPKQTQQLIDLGNVETQIWAKLTTVDAFTQSQKLRTDAIESEMVDFGKRVSKIDDPNTGYIHQNTSDIASLADTVTKLKSTLATEGVNVDPNTIPKNSYNPDTGGTTSGGGGTDQCQWWDIGCKISNTTFKNVEPYLIIGGLGVAALIAISIIKK